MSLESLQNKHNCERIFMIGNGPSLAETPLDALADEYTFALNRIDEVYDETSWRPSFYFFTWSALRERDRKAITKHIEMGIPCFITNEHAGDLPNEDNVYFFKRRTLFDSPFEDQTIAEIEEADLTVLEKYWSDDINEEVCSFHSMLAMIQIAVYIGFDEIYLVGVDLGFDPIKTHMLFEGGEDPQEYDNRRAFLRDAVRKGSPLRSLVNMLTYEALDSRARYPVVDAMRTLGLLSDPNHFSSDYRYELVPNDSADEEHIKSHTLAKRLCDDRGVDVYNATLGGHLEVYPRVDLNEILAMSATACPSPRYQLESVS